MVSIDIGSAPCDEECVQVGSSDYSTRAREECQRYIDLIHKVFGPEPKGSRLKITSNEHDFGVYFNVEIEFDETNTRAYKYALDVEAHAPATWEGDRLE